MYRVVVICYSYTLYITVICNTLQQLVICDSHLRYSSMFYVIVFRYILSLHVLYILYMLCYMLCNAFQLLAICYSYMSCVKVICHVSQLYVIVICHMSYVIVTRCYSYLLYFFMAMYTLYNVDTCYMLCSYQLQSHVIPLCKVHISTFAFHS